MFSFAQWKMFCWDPTIAKLHSNLRVYSLSVVRNLKIQSAHRNGSFFLCTFSCGNSTDRVGNITWGGMNAVPTAIPRSSFRSGSFFGKRAWWCMWSVKHYIEPRRHRAPAKRSFVVCRFDWQDLHLMISLCNGIINGGKMKVMRHKLLGSNPFFL